MRAPTSKAIALLAAAALVLAACGGGSGQPTAKGNSGASATSAPISATGAFGPTASTATQPHVAASSAAWTAVAIAVGNDHACALTSAAASKPHSNRVEQVGQA